MTLQLEHRQIYNLLLLLLQVNKDQLALRVNLAILVSMGKKETEVSLVIPVLLEILDYKDSQGNL